MGTHTSPSSRSSRRSAQVVLDAIRRIVRDLRESSRAAEVSLGISGAQLFVLEQLSRAPALSINELAEVTLTHQSTVSVVARRLVEAGLARRRTSPADARRVELSLSPAGRDLLKRAPATAQSRLIDGVRKLRAADRAALARGLGRLVETIGLAPAPQMFFEVEARRRQAARR